MANIGEYLDVILTFFGTVFAGAGLKGIEVWMKKAKDKDDTATNLRNELRGELTALKIEIQTTEQELDLWKEKYYDMYKTYLEMKAELEAARALLEKSSKIETTTPLTPPNTV